MKIMGSNICLNKYSYGSRDDAEVYDLDNGTSMRKREIKLVDRENLS